VEHELFSKDGQAVLRMRGKFTHRDYGDFLAVIESMATLAPASFAFDMEELDFIDSGGIGMLLMALDVARRHAIPLIIRKAKGQAKSVIENAHLGELFTLD